MPRCNTISIYTVRMLVYDYRLISCFVKSIINFRLYFSLQLYYWTVSFIIFLLLLTHGLRSNPYMDVTFQDLFLHHGYVEEGIFPWPRSRLCFHVGIVIVADIRVRMLKQYKTDAKIIFWSILDYKLNKCNVLFFHVTLSWIKTGFDTIDISPIKSLISTGCRRGWSYFKPVNAPFKNNLYLTWKVAYVLKYYNSKFANRQFCHVPQPGGMTHVHNIW